MKRAVSFLHLGHAGNAFQTRSAAFSQAVVKAVTIPSVQFWGGFADPLLPLQSSAAFGGCSSQTDRQTDVALAGHVPILVHKAEPAGVCPCQVTPAHSLLRQRSTKCWIWLIFPRTNWELITEYFAKQTQKWGVSSTVYFTSSNRKLSGHPWNWSQFGHWPIVWDCQGKVITWYLPWPGPPQSPLWGAVLAPPCASWPCKVLLYDYFNLCNCGVCVLDVQYSVTWLFMHDHGSPVVSVRSCLTASWQQLSQENGKVWQRERSMRMGGWH